MSSRTFWIALPCAAVLALAGCGDEPDTTAADTPDTSPSASTTTPTAPATPTASPSPTTPSPTLTPTATESAPDETTPSATPTEEPTDEPTEEPPGDETPTATEEPPGDEPDGESNETTDRAITRFEAFLHALGEKDIATMCEIAGPAASEIEDAGYGDCETNMSAMADQPTDAQSAALSEATVDPAAIDTSNPEGVVIPATAVEASEEFTAENLGDFKLAFQEDDWYIVV